MIGSRRIHRPEDFGRVALLMGGAAAEREISLKSGGAVLAALQRLGVNVTGHDVGARMLIPLLESTYDRVFNIIHGRGGEDGVLQGALEALDIPYTGSGVLASALSMDKLKTKQCWKSDGIPTPPWQLLRKEADLDLCAQSLGFPVIVKPAKEGSSLGMSKAENRAQLVGAWKTAAGYGCDVFAEQWIQGREYTVAVLGETALPLIRLETPNLFYDYEAKYFTDTTRYHCPCGLPVEQERGLQTLALQACRTLDVCGWGRVDLLLDGDDRACLIEVNTVPGMTDHSLVPMAAKGAGMDFDELVWRILETSVPFDGAQGE